MAKYAKDAEKVFQMTYASPARSQSNSSGGWALSAFLITVIPLTIFNGWVLSVIWNWFIPTTFDGAPVLTVGQALGVSLVVSSMVSVARKGSRDDKSLGYHVLFGLAFGIVRGLIFLLLGFVYHFFV